MPSTIVWVAGRMTTCRWLLSPAARRRSALGAAVAENSCATLSLTTGGAVVVTATHLDLRADSSTSSLTESVVSGLLARLSVTLAPSAVPFGIVPTAVRAEGSEIVVVGTGTDVTVVGGKTGR